MSPSSQVIGLLLYKITAKYLMPIPRKYILKFCRNFIGGPCSFTETYNLMFEVPQLKSPKPAFCLFCKTILTFLWLFKVENQLLTTGCVIAAFSLHRSWLLMYVQNLHSVLSAQRSWQISASAVAFKSPMSLMET